MATPAFISVNFIDPWGTVPPGTFQTGVLCTVDDSTAPPGTVAVARLLQGNAPLAYGNGGTPGFVAVSPPGPLTASLTYVVQAQWVPQGTSSQDADWTVAGIAQAPVITSGLAVSGGQVASGSTTLSWTPEGSAQPNYGLVKIYDVAAGSSAAIVLAAGGAGTTTSFAYTAGRAYGAYAAAAALIDPATPGVYTTGPYAPAVAVPVDAPTVTGVSYDLQGQLTVGWTAPAPPPSPLVADPVWWMVLVTGGAAVARFRADAGGGSAVVDPGAWTGGLSVAGQAQYGGILGPVGTPQPIIPAAPGIVEVTLADSGTPPNVDVTVTVQPPANLPAGAFINVSLLKDGVAVSSGAAQGTPPRASFSYDMSDGAHYSVAAQGVNTIAGVQASYGPRVATGVLRHTATGVTASYDGSRLALVWAFTPEAGVPLTGFQVALAGATTQTLLTGPEQVLLLPASLRVGDAVTATVTPLSGVVTGRASASASYTVPAPAATTIGEVAVDGSVVSLAWAPSAGPWVDGYQVTVSGTGEGVTPSFTLHTGLETSTRFTLPPQGAQVAWSVAVAPTAGGTAGTASPPVALFAAVPVVSGLTVSGTEALVGWHLAPATAAVVDALNAAGAQVVAQVVDGGNVVSSASGPVGSGSGTVTVPFPTAPAGRMYATVQLVSASQTGSRSAPVPVLAGTPQIVYGDLANGGLSLRWSASGDEGVTGYTVSYGGATVTTTETEAFLPLAPSAMPAGGVTVTPVAPGPGVNGPAATMQVVGAYGVDAGAYDGATLSVTLSSPSIAAAQTWVDVVVDNAVVARTVVTGAPPNPVTVPVALRPGSGAQVRATGVGAGPITPPGPAAAIPTSAPSAVVATWDGTTLRVSWTPVPDPGVSGYLVSVNGADPPVQPQLVAGAATASATIAAAFTGAWPGSAGVQVQAVAAAGGNQVKGPAGAVSVPALAPAVRAVAAAATAQPPYLYRRGAYQQLSGIDTANVVVYLPNVFTAQTPPTVTSSDSLWSLAPAGSPTSAAAAYTLTIDKSVWTTFGADATRPALRDSSIAFLQQVETAGVVPWGIGLVRQAIATGLPQTFAETLYYRYGVWQDSKLRVVDLEPGLRLRVSGAVYQTVAASVSDVRNGYVALGTETYDLAQVFPAGTGGLQPALTVDAFLSQLFPGAPGTASTVIGGPMDFFGLAGREAYFRIFYPPSFQGSGGQGSPSATGNVAIVGAASWTALEAATSYYATNANFPPGATLFIAWFRGRAALTPLLQVEMGGEQRWVPVGTTLRQLLAQSGQAPVFGTGAAGEVAMARPVSSVYDYPQGGAPLRMDAVDLSGADLGSLQPQLWPLDVPLLGGDRVNVAPPGT